MQGPITSQHDCKTTTVSQTQGRNKQVRKEMLSEFNFQTALIAESLPAEGH
jgi:hypothetical protein